jgi:hypothetical protein
MKYLQKKLVDVWGDFQALLTLIEAKIAGCNFSILGVYNDSIK